MPKIDIATAPTRKGSSYPAPFDQPVAERLRHRLGDAGGITDFGVNLMHLPPGVWSSQRHWHSQEDELVFILEGEVVLVEDAGETILRPGDCATFAKGSANGHHLINRGTTMAKFLEIGSRHEADECSYPDIDLHAVGDGYIHKDGTPYK
ncbi:MAG: cupin domain-containing protein [Kofleriaceae bacterium]